MDVQSSSLIPLSALTESWPLMLVIMIILIIFSAFFSMSETAISSSSDSKIKLMIEERKRGAKKALELATDEIEVVMAGVKGKFAIDDFLGAGLILSYMPYNDLTEFAKTSVISVKNKNVMNNAVLDSYSSQRLHNLGSGADVKFCLKHNSSKNVPIYKNSYLTKL